MPTLDGGMSSSPAGEIYPSCPLRHAVSAHCFPAPAFGVEKLLQGCVTVSQHDYLILLIG